MGATAIPLGSAGAPPPPLSALVAPPVDQALTAQAVSHYTTATDPDGDYQHDRPLLAANHADVDMLDASFRAAGQIRAQRDPAAAYGQALPYLKGMGADPALVANLSVPGTAGYDARHPPGVIKRAGNAAVQGLGEAASVETGLGDEVHGGLQAAERPVLQDQTTGALTRRGYDFVTKAMAGSVVPDAGLLEAAPPSVLQKLARAAPQMARIRLSEPEWDLSGPMAEAVALVTRAHADGEPVEALLEPGMFEDVDARARELALALAHDTPAQFSLRLGKYAAEAARFPKGQELMPWTEGAPSEETLFATGAPKSLHGMPPPSSARELREWASSGPRGLSPKQLSDYIAQGENPETLADLLRQPDQWRARDALREHYGRVASKQTLRVYRSSDAGPILPGEYVSESLPYVRRHELATAPSGEERIYSITVQPDELWTYGSAHEFIYAPKTPDDGFRALMKQLRGATAGADDAGVPLVLPSGAPTPLERSHALPSPIVWDEDGHAVLVSPSGWAAVEGARAAAGLPAAGNADGLLIQKHELRAMSGTMPGPLAAAAAAHPEGLAVVQHRGTPARMRRVRLEELAHLWQALVDSGKSAAALTAEGARNLFLSPAGRVALGWVQRAYGADLAATFARAIGRGAAPARAADLLALQATMEVGARLRIGEYAEMGITETEGSALAQEYALGVKARWGDAGLARAESVGQRIDGGSLGPWSPGAYSSGGTAPGGGDAAPGIAPAPSRTLAAPGRVGAAVGREGDLSSAIGAPAATGPLTEPGRGLLAAVFHGWAS